MKNLLILVVIVFFIFPGCTQKQKVPDVNVEAVADTYAELLVLNERYSLSKDSLSAQRYTSDYQDILREHKFTQKQYVSVLESVVQSPVLSKQLFDRMMAKLQEKNAKGATKNKQGRP
jgi:hypothetical protein